MAGLLASDPVHHGAFEAGAYTTSQDKSEDAGGRWYFSRKEIEENSPSRQDGIDLKKETYLRKSYCTFLQDLGMRLKVPQVTIATAIIFCHRFFLRQSHAKNDRRTVATVCMFLAGKVEETPRPLRDVILVSYEIIHKKDSATVQKIKQKEVYEQQKELLLLCEIIVLATLGFDLNVFHPYKPLVEAIKKFKVAQNALAQVAWNFVNDGLRTSLCLQFKPHHIAAGAIFLAAKFLKVKLPSDGDKVWWQEFDVTPRQLEEVSNQMLELYEQNRVPPQGSEPEGSAGGGQQPPTKVHADSGENVASDGRPPSSGATSKAGSSKPAMSKPIIADADNHVGSARNDIRNSEPHGNRYHEQKQIFHNESSSKMVNSRLGSEGLGEEEEEEEEEEEQLRDKKRHGRTVESHKDDGAVGQSPQEVVKKIDKDKVKAALEKRRKSRPEVSHRRDLDDDDLIESALENGMIPLEERKQNSSKSSNSSYHVKARDDDELGGGGGEGHHHQSKKRSYSHGEDLENVEEGELEPFEGGGKYSKRKKTGSPTTAAAPLSHHDLPEDRSRFSRLGYNEREHKRHAQENHA